jgi:hypothetical protein
MKKIKKVDEYPGNFHPYVDHGNIDPLIITVNKLVDAVNKLLAVEESNSQEIVDSMSRVALCPSCRFSLLCLKPNDETTTCLIRDGQVTECSAYKPKSKSK